MKYIIVTLALILSSTACKKAPRSPGFAGERQGGEPVGDPVIDDGNLVPTEVTGEFKPLECSKTPTAGLRTWRRLSNVEFANTVDSVFGVKVDPQSLTGDISHIDVFDTMMVTGNFVDSQRLSSYRTAAKNIAAKVDLAKVFPCLATGAACMTSTLPALGSMAWRRPLEEAEVSKLAALFTALVPDVGNEQAARFIVQTLVMSESFIYRSELGGNKANGVYTLTDWEMASALSYAIVRRPPDSTLRGLAQAKSLGNTAEIKKQIARLFADPNAKATWKDFGNMWLDSKKIMATDRMGVAEFTPALKSAAYLEVGDLFSEVMASPTGSNLATFYNADSIPATDATKAIYNVAPAAGRVKFQEADRRGPLGLASFLISTAVVDHTSPVRRGAFVIERMMCSSFANFDTIPFPKKAASQTNRDIYLGLENGSCGGCHKPMNQIGFIFEGFDMMGRVRKEAEGVAIKIDSNPKLDGAEVPVKTVSDFVSALAKSKQGQECVARQMFRYGFGRKELIPQPIISSGSVKVKVSTQADIDSCQLKAAVDAMEAKNGDIKEVLAELFSSEAFRKRVERMPIR